MAGPLRNRRSTPAGIAPIGVVGWQNEQVMGWDNTASAKPAARRRGGVVALAVVLTAASLSGCGWGDDSGSGQLDLSRSGVQDTAPVLRYVAAPMASAPTPLPDPRCRAARRLFLRAAITSSPRPFVVDEHTEALLDQVEVLATDEIRADLDATREFVGRFLDSPDSLTGSDLSQSVDRMDRLLLWTITVCPPPQRPVWACSTQVDHPHGDPFRPLYFDAVGQLTPNEAIDQTVGPVTGTRIELVRSANRVVFGWVDAFGLVRRRAEVKRFLDLWFLTDAQRCDDPLNRPHPLDSGEVIVEELPDIVDGPQYAPVTEPPTTTTTTTLPEESTTSVTLSPTVPPRPCRWDPNDTTDDYETLGEYMARGPAESGCWELLTAEGKECMKDPPSGEFFACFDV